MSLDSKYNPKNIEDKWVENNFEISELEVQKIQLSTTKKKATPKKTAKPKPAAKEKE